MKKIIIIIVIIAGLVLFFSMRNDFPTDKIEAPGMSEGRDFRPDPSNATFILDDEPITLSSGRNERSIIPESALTEEIILMDKFTYGDINRDGKEDTVLLLARYGGGSGTFIYLAAFVSGPVTYHGSKATFLGDRIVPQSISVNGDTVSVEYLDRGPDEALAAEPTVPMSKQFIYRNGELQER